MPNSKILTVHDGLRWIMSHADASDKLAQWRLRLYESNSMLCTEPASDTELQTYFRVSQLMGKIDLV